MTKALLVLAVLSCSLQAQDMSLDIEVGTKRAPTPAMNEFRRLTGYPKGRPGFVVDHLVPYCAGGAAVDVVANLAWQERTVSFQKDVFERQLCREMARQGLVMIKREQ